MHPLATPLRASIVATTGGNKVFTIIEEGSYLYDDAVGIKVIDMLALGGGSSGVAIKRGFHYN